MSFVYTLGLTLMLVVSGVRQDQMGTPNGRDEKPWADPYQTGQHSGFYDRQRRDMEKIIVDCWHPHLESFTKCIKETCEKDFGGSFTAVVSDHWKYVEPEHDQGYYVMFQYGDTSKGQDYKIVIRK